MIPVNSSLIAAQASAFFGTINRKSENSDAAHGNLKEKAKSEKPIRKLQDPPIVF